MRDLIELIQSQIPASVLGIARLSGLAIYGPILSSPAVPVNIRALLVAALGIVLGTCMPRPDVELSLASLGPCVAAEVLVGLIIGFVASMPMVTAQLAGLITGQQLGLGFAMIYNPAADTEADALGQMLFFMVLATFLAMGGFEATFLAVLNSYSHIPAGAYAPDGRLITLMTGLLQSSMEVALRVSAPVLAIVFLETIAMGFLAKTLPQLSLLNIGFPLRIILGLGMLTVGLTIIHEVMVEDAFDAINAVTAFLELAS